VKEFLRRFALALVIVAVLTVTAVSSAYWIAARKVANVATIKIDPALLEPGNNFLFVGSDTRAFVKSRTDEQHFGSAEVQTGQRSDTIMVAHVDPKHGTGYLVSFPRDLWVDIPGIGGSKINAAFNAGPQRVIETIEHNFNIPISHYLEVDFAGFRKIVDALGTIPIYFPAPARDQKTGLDITKAGCWHLHGDQALAYVRSRYYESYVNGEWRADPTSDLGRIRRQQYFLRTVAQQTLHKSERAPWRAPAILDQMLASMQRDQKLGLNPLRALANAFRGSNGALQTVTLPTTRQFINGQDALVLDAAKAAPMLARLRGELDDARPAAPRGVAPKSVTVAVQNGSGRAHAGGDALTALHRLGFATASPATNADRSDYAVSEVRYAPGAENKGALVLAQLGGAGKLVALDAAPGNADVLLVIGRDFRSVAAPTTAARKGTSSSKPAAAKSPSTTPPAGC
jgi:polyisoprenyl-teichoic acid--peptidoglycan teichoic acid transferase